MIPARPKINIYQSSKNALLFLFKDSDGADYDLSIYSSIKGVVLRGFDRKNPVLEFEPTITGNQLSYTFSPEVTEATFPRSGYVIEFRFFSSEWIPLVVAEVVLNNAFKAGTVLNQSELIVTEEQVIVNMSETAELAGIALGAAEEAVQAKEDTEAAATQALIDIEYARVAALGQIGTAETDAVTAVNNARDTGVLAVEGARDQGVGAVETARDNAITAINLLVTQAEEARDESVAAKDISVEAKNDAVEAKDDAVSAKEDAETAQTGSETARDESVAAKDEIVDKIDFTGLVEGDILRRGGTKLVRMSEVEFLKRKEPLVESFAGNLYDLARIKAWHSFIGVDATPFTHLDSGQAVTNVLGSLVLQGNVGIPTANPTFVKFPIDLKESGSGSRPDFSFRWRLTIGLEPFINLRRVGVRIIKDNDNYIEIRVGQAAVTIVKVVLGVSTTLINIDIPGGDNVSRAIGHALPVEMFFGLRGRDGQSALIYYDPRGGNVERLVVNSSDINEIFPETDKVNELGLFTLHSSNTGAFVNFIVEDMTV
jgi:hypothetical protein